MATTQKALSMANDIVSELSQRQSALAVSLSFDTDGSPLIQVGAGTAGSAGGIIKVQPISWPNALDVLGLTAQIFHPHVIKLGLEANYAGTNDNIADINTAAQLTLLMGIVLTRGTRVEVYQSTNGTAPSATTLADSTKLVASWEPNAQYPMVSSQ